MAKELTPTEIVPSEILNEEGSNQDQIDLEAQFSKRVKERARFIQAARTGDLDFLRKLSKESGSSELFQATDADGNTCLHLAVMDGRHRDVVDFILSYDIRMALHENRHRQNPLMLAASSPCEDIGLLILEYSMEKGVPVDVMAQDDNRDTAVHHAVRNRHSQLALRLIESNPEVSKLVNRNSESLMYIACSTGLTDVFSKLLGIPLSARDAPGSRSVLTTAIVTGRIDIFKEILDKDGTGSNLVEALHCAIRCHDSTIVRMLLMRDNNLGFYCSSTYSPFCCAAEEGNVSIGKEIIKQCSVAAGFLVDLEDQRNALHIAIHNGHMGFVKFIVRTPELGRLLDQTDESGQTPLHLAAKNCRPQIVRELLANQRIDYFPIDNKGFTALDLAYFNTDNQQFGGFNWSEVVTLLSDASCPLTAPFEVRHKAKQNFIDVIRRQADAVTNSYRTSTSTVGILMTTVTFAAAFTLPGGYISDKGPTQGFPVLSRKAAFQAFLISDTLAMCASLMATFICSMYRLTDIDFVLHYAAKIGYLMWFSYSTMAVAFATGLYTVLAPTNLWLSISVCVLCSFVPLLSYYLVDWPVVKLYRQVHDVLKINLNEVL